VYIYMVKISAYLFGIGREGYRACNNDANSSLSTTVELQRYRPLAVSCS